MESNIDVIHVRYWLFLGADIEFVSLSQVAIYVLSIISKACQNVECQLTYIRRLFHFPIDWATLAQYPFGKAVASV
jgi:hypothetical protein